MIKKLNKVIDLPSKRVYETNRKANSDDFIKKFYLIFLTEYANQNDGLDQRFLIIDPNPFPQQYDKDYIPPFNVSIIAIIYPIDRLNDNNAEQEPIILKFD